MHPTTTGPNSKPLRCAVYVRVSTADQYTENQQAELRRYIEARGWTITREYIDKGISGATDRRPALIDLMRDAKRRTFNTLCVWSLDRLGRNLSHLIMTIDELAALGVAFVSIREGMDTSTPMGRLQMQIAGAFAEFERNRLRERTVAGLDRARAAGKTLGRPRKVHPKSAALEAVADLSHAKAAARLGVSVPTIKRLRRERRQGSESPATNEAAKAAVTEELITV